MQNSCAMRWEELPHEVVASPRASRRAKWVFALGLVSIVYAYALFLYASNPIIQHWLAVRWPITAAPGVFLLIMASGLVFSLPASVMGFRELSAIRRQEIPRAGRVITWIGLLLAIVSSILFFIGILALRFVKGYVLRSLNPFGR